MANDCLDNTLSDRDIELAKGMKLANTDHISIKEFSFHRNGICGEGFYIFKFYCKDTKQDMISVYFPYDKDENPTVAVFNQKLLGDGVIAFGQNSWRGDHYCDQFEIFINWFEDFHERSGLFVIDINSYLNDNINSAWNNK